MSLSLVPQDFINDLLARCDIVQLIDTHVPLRKKGKNYIACCPFHTEKTPSFTVVPEKQFYYCFGCSAGGNALSFLMDYERLTFPEAVEQLAEQLGLKVPYFKSPQSTTQQIISELYPLLEQIAAFYEKQLMATPHAINYLKSRGLSVELAKKFTLGYAPSEWNLLSKNFNNTNALLAAGLLIKKSEAKKGYYDRFRDRIIFPIRDKRGRIIGFGGRLISQNQNEAKYLNSPETPLFHKRKELYGLYESSHQNYQADYFIVVEGYMDVLALFEAGLPCTVATLGTATSIEQLLRLFSMKQEIIFCFDGDEAGRKAAWRVLETSLALLQDGYLLRFLLLPEGEDPDSFIRKKGREAFIALLKKSYCLGDFLFKQLLTQLDINQIEGKARLSKLAVPLIEKIPRGVIQHKLFEQLAHLVNIDVFTLRQVTKSGINKHKKIFTKKPTPVTKMSSMRLAIALLIQHPHLAKTLSPKQEKLLMSLVLPGSTLLKKLFFLLKKSPGLTGGMLLEHWRQEEQVYKILQQLLRYSITIPETGLTVEFHDLLNHLKKITVQQDIDKLLQQAKQSELTTDEKKQLYQLILSARSNSE